MFTPRAEASAVVSKNFPSRRVVSQHSQCLCIFIVHPVLRDVFPPYIYGQGSAMMRPRLPGASQSISAVQIQRRWRFHAVIARLSEDAGVKKDVVPIPHSIHPAVEDLLKEARRVRRPRRRDISSCSTSRKPDEVHRRCEIVSPELCGTSGGIAMWTL